jgi:DNA invertase Pin-like site-specific DNA recombinase
MKIFGYIWANDAGPMADPAARRILAFAKQKRLPEPSLQFESEEEAFIPFADRTQGAVVLSRLRRSDVLIVPNESFLFRTAVQGQTLLRLLTEKGIGLFSAEAKAADLLEPRALLRALSLLEMLAHYELEASAHRRRSSIRRLQASGHYLGGNTPIGMVEKGDGSLMPDPSFRKTLRTILRLRADGRSFRKISEELKKQGVNLSHSSIASIIKKARVDYSGG